MYVDVLLITLKLVTITLKFVYYCSHNLKFVYYCSQNLTNTEGNQFLYLMSRMIFSKKSFEDFFAYNLWISVAWTHLLYFAEQFMCPKIELFVMVFISYDTGRESGLRILVCFYIQNCISIVFLPQPRGKKVQCVVAINAQTTCVVNHNVAKPVSYTLLY